MSYRRRREGRRVSEVYGAAGLVKTSSPPRLLHQSKAVTGRQIALQVQDTRSCGNVSGGNMMTKGPPAAAKPSRKNHHAGALTTSKSRSGTHVVTIGPSSTSSDSALSQGDFDRYELFYEKRRSAIGVITGIFTCWSKSKDGGQVAGANMFTQSRQVTSTMAPPHLNSLSAAALLEQAKAQQEVLLETQDTSDMWEWHMEQQQTIASQEHEMLERNSNAGANSGDHFPASICPPPLLPAGSRENTTPTPILKLKKPPERELAPHDEDVEDDDATQEWESPAWGWRQHEAETAGEKILSMFETALLRFRWEVNTFCRVYMQQIVRAGYSLINTLMEMEANTVFLRRVHASYALEARINAALFRCFENDSFDDSGLTHIFDPSARAVARLQEFMRMKGLDPAEALRMHSPSYEPAFHNFAAAKSEEVLALLPAAALAFRSAAQRDRFMDAFLRAAKWAWLLHRLATSTTLPATILRVARGHPVDAMYVESVAVPPIGSCTRCPVTAHPTVEFMIMPGFVAQRKVFRCRIYQHFMCKQQ
ncbi:hypothetical protein GOP47_0025918 [Adiantum capillus-veneris]|uniref:Uncharacterized protein n=1 Tax=Adiantum capillus-veneris TaxID=13818 RepID=A0A9D4U155_ADICA|nr:hypothetical protein GOP47_0025918 [Adiantum capillus-veneris]